MPQKSLSAFSHAEARQKKAAKQEKKVLIILKTRRLPQLTLENGTKAKIMWKITLIGLYPFELSRIMRHLSRDRATDATRRDTENLNHPLAALSNL
jgi:hypothetical protein